VKLAGVVGHRPWRGKVHIALGSSIDDLHELRLPGISVPTLPDRPGYKSHHLFGS
jgi:hypothetical protein